MCVIPNAVRDLTDGVLVTLDSSCPQRGLCEVLRSAQDDGLRALLRLSHSGSVR